MPPAPTSFRGHEAAVEATRRGAYKAAVEEAVEEAVLIRTL